MKKILLPLASCFVAGSLLAQTTFVQEDFESGIPGTWSQQTNATDGGWNSGTAASLSSQFWTIDGGNATNIVATNDDDCDCDKSADYFITPSINTSGASTVIVEFDRFFLGNTYQGNTEVATIEYSTNGGSSWSVAHTLTGNTAWVTEQIDLSADLAGQSNLMVAFRYNDATGWLFGYAIDNVHIYEPAPDDIAVTDISTGKYQLAGNVNITGTVLNNGTNTINSFDLTWDDGTGPYTETINQTIPSLGTYNFTHGTQLTVAAGTNYTVTVTATLAGDGNASNNMMTADIAGMAFQTSHNVYGEEATGTWCGWCPRGAVALADMESTSTWIGVAVHNGDPMVVTDWDNGIGGFIGGYPSGVVDRVLVGDPTDFLAQHNQRQPNIAPADLQITNASFDGSTITFDVECTWAVTTSGDFRLNAAVTENNVTGTGSGYAQANYYSFQSNNIALTGAGLDWQAQPNPVPASVMEYDHVGRGILDGFNGGAGTVPASVNANDVNTKTYTYTLGAGEDINNFKLIGILHDNANGGEVLNAIEADAPVGIHDVDYNFEVAIFPNPTNDIAYIKLDLSEASHVSMDIMSITGALVKSNDYGTISGTQSFVFNGADLENGIYMVKITVDDQVITKRINLSK